MFQGVRSSPQQASKLPAGRPDLKQYYLLSLRSRLTHPEATPAEGAMQYSSKSSPIPAGLRCSEN